jgi:serine/threonine protein kinase/tetratricopeptide (TPR) repeat protein
MTPQRYERLCRLFESACELEPEQRSALLDRECADDPTLRRDVETLLARDTDPSSFLDSPALGDDFGLADVDRLVPGAAEHESGHRIDRYVIRETLGEGGVAVVYLAEQEEPVRRRVALKVIKPGMDSRQVIARFEAERQALAMMDHPGVAKVFDAGSTETGRPYFVMEYVPGVSITKHCDRQRLNVEDRLRLFTQVCEAVQHAHQKGIIHRDLKPGNVLVLVKDGQAIPKVIDFGVAKALHQRLTERTIFTEQGQLIGTPAYMSPEQAEMTAQDIDTRSDIYALGVLLYELLTGTLPFEAKRLSQAGLGEIQRIIRDEEPPKPSTRLSNDGDDSTAHAQICRADPRSLVRALRGDLDWIVMKALEKDRTRRYETAHGLALDIRRHLEHEPVQAGPPSRAYRLRKFVRRNRAGVAAGVVAALSLIAATAVSAGFALSEAEQRRAAATERDIAEAINEFLNNDLLAAVAPSAEAGKGKDVLMRDVLDVAAERIEAASGAGGRFEDMLLVEAAIRQTLGETYLALGEYRAARPHAERAWELRRQVLGEEHPETLKSVACLADVYHQQGRFSEAESLLLQTLAVSTRVRGEAHPDTLSFLAHLAGIYRARGPYERAEPLRRFVRDLASTYHKQRRDDEAELLDRDVLGIVQRVLGKEHVDALSFMGSVAWMNREEGHYDEADRLYLELLELRKRLQGEEHPDTIVSMRTIARLYNIRGHFDEAESLQLETIEMSERVLGKEHQLTLVWMNDLAGIYVNQGRYDEAESLYLQTLEKTKRVLGDTYPETLTTMGDLAVMYANQGRYDEAESLLLQMLELSKRKQVEDPWYVVEAMSLLAWLDELRGRFDLALEIRSEVAERPGASYWDLNDYAWLLLTAEPETLRDPETALEMALRANEMSGYRWSTQLFTLALAYLRTGDTTKALEMEQLALDLLPDYTNDRYRRLRRPPAYFQETLEQAFAGGEKEGDG